MSEQPRRRRRQQLIPEAPEMTIEETMEEKTKTEFILPDIPRSISCDTLISSASQNSLNLVCCPDCGQHVSNRAEYCIHCGAPLKNPLEKLIPQMDQLWETNQDQECLNACNEILFLDPNNYVAILRRDICRRHIENDVYVIVASLDEINEAQVGERKKQIDTGMYSHTTEPPLISESDSTDLYIITIADRVNFRRAPQTTGTSLDRIPYASSLMLLGEEFDGTYTWYKTNYNGQDGYVRSDMVQVLTSVQLQDYLAGADVLSTVNAAQESNSNSSRSGTLFTNAYGTATTRCVVSGCYEYIASSGDTNCCIIIF